MVLHVVVYRLVLHLVGSVYRYLYSNGSEKMLPPEVSELARPAGGCMRGECFLEQEMNRTYH